MRDVQTRVAWLLALIGSCLILMILQLYRLTVPQSQLWQGQAVQNMLREIPNHGPRGSIYDHKGRALATSEPAFAAVLIKQAPAYVDQILPKLALLLSAGEPLAAREIEAHVRRLVQENRVAGRQYQPIFIARKLSPVIVAQLYERRDEFDGVVLVAEGARNYPGGSLAGSVLGYVGAISSDQLQETAFSEYYADEIVGKDGLELFYERELRGGTGKRSVLVDPWGRPMSDMNETPPTPGKNLYLTLDIDLQKRAEDALIEQMEWIKSQHDPEANPIRATMVVQDVRTGAILAMASVPTFDPNRFAAGITDSEWNELIAHPARPLQNWTLMGYAPGSTYKMGVGLAGLAAGVISPYEQINCTKVYWRYHNPLNWAPYEQGYADIARALAISCDPYFYETGHLLGIDRMAAFMKQFGFGESTGIDLPGEQVGINPTQRSYGSRWTPGQILSVSIGQGDVLATPLQLASYTATIANNGVRYRPYLVQEIRTAAGDVARRYQPEALNKLQVAPDLLTRVQEGMRQTVTSREGTAYRAFAGFPIAAAAKTGSTETGHAWSNGLAVAYAPYDSPQIAVSAVIEGGSHGSWAVPAIRAVMAQYFGVKEKHDPGAAIKSD